LTRSRPLQLSLQDVGDRQLSLRLDTSDRFHQPPPKAWNSATVSAKRAARAVLIEIARGHDGTNNGRLGLSIRRASERCNIARGTAQRAFIDLQERGFIDCMSKGAFSRKALHATEWRLTWWRCDVTGELPSKKFMSWRREKQNAVSKYPVAVSNQGQRAA
jgi:hypothetical protein